MPVFDAMPEGATTVESEVCIVGAGAAGLFLANRLVWRGLRVVLLEAGGRTCVPGESMGMEAAVEGPYRGASEGRAFGLGGTTALWGGQLVPHSSLDFRPAENGIFEPWRHIVSTVERHTASAAATLGLAPGPDWFLAERLIPSVASTLRSRGWETVTADWLPFGKRNLSFLLGGLPGEKSGLLSVFVNAPVVSWDLRSAARGHARVESLAARSGGKDFLVRARAYVLAAGTIESTRMLLEMERACPASPFRGSAAIGRGLSDHLSCRVADVLPGDEALCARLFGPRFHGGRMKTFRFVERQALPEAPRGFFHFIYNNENAGFLLAKKSLAGLQSRTLPRVSPGEAIHGVSGLAALAWNRWARRRLYIPKKTPVHLQLDLEQAPRDSNCVRLGNESDALGRPKVLIEWRPGDGEDILRAAKRFLSRWPPRQEGFPGLAPVTEDASGLKPHDVYHPVGTCRMGVDAGAVVDPELRVHGADNLFVLSTAVFPSAGTANPTFSMLCLGEALSQRLAEELRAG
jgi:choline dehydrogenase-like flavoprotein